MRRPRIILPVAWSLGLAGLLCAGSAQVYDEKADAREQIRSAIAQASGPGSPRNIVLVFGANWCKDCHALDAQMHRAELASLIEKSFMIVRIDVGRMDKNLDMARKYGVPVGNGIPALAVLNSKGKLLFAQHQGEFAGARTMTYESFKAFFERWKPQDR